MGENMVDTNIVIGNKVLLNPVGVASGTFGYGNEYDGLVDFSSIGAIYTKAITAQPRPGNSAPRIVETPCGIINSIGLANVGVKRFCEEKMSYLSSLPCAVIPNIAGSTEEEYQEVLEILEKETDVFGYEINVSCPNVKRGAMAFGTDPVIVERLTAKLRKLTSRPLIIKLTPNVTDISVIAVAAENGGADAVSCINTLIGMVIDVQTGKSITGGLSGPAILPIGVAMVSKVVGAVSIPVIGMGGIMNANDALQYFIVGASAVQVGTGNFINSKITTEVLEGITEFCINNDINRIENISKSR